MTVSSDDERLRGAFRALASDTSAQCSAEDLENVWKAVSGGVPADARREMIDRAAGDPAFAEAWRIAYEVQHARGEIAPEAMPVRRYAWSGTWLSLAAALVLVIGLALVQLQDPPADVFRDQSRNAATSLIPPDSTLSREAFRLRWTPGPDNSTYSVRVTTEDLQLLATAEGLTSPELVVPTDRLSAVGPGARVLWQVITHLPNGESFASDTFVVRVE